MRNEREKSRDRIENAIEIIKTASENLEKGVCLLSGIIGRMDAAEDYAKFQRGKFCVIKDNSESTEETSCPPDTQEEPEKRANG